MLFTSGATVVHSSYTPSRQAITVPAEVVADFFIVEAQVAGRGPFQFLVDTGSSVSLVSPALARQLGDAGHATESSFAIRSSSQRTATLPAIVLPRLELGSATFRRVPAAVFDFGDLSRQLGKRIDGIIGFSVFRDVVFTIDYPARRLVIDPRGTIVARASGTVDCYGDGGLPLAAVEVGGHRVVALIDTGSDSAVTLNSATDAARLVRDSRRGSVRATLAGDEPQVIGRLDADVRIGPHRVERPPVEMADGLPSLGNGVLRHFAVTFDPRHQLMTLRRDASAPIQFAPQRSVGLGFAREEGEWRVAAIVPDTPAERSDIRVGDRCVRINGQPTPAWPLERYQSLLRASETVTFTFASAGGREADLRLPVVELVR
ncbi:MAG: aspartyl protease family protein [Opitutae bacterium]|nr:aspartyl protease family protein [Opitutae bacterium]